MRAFTDAMPHNRLKNILSSISFRIALPLFLTLLLFITAIYYVLLPQLEQSFITRKQEAIKEQTETVVSLVESYHEREASGELSRKEAQDRAIARIRRLRYGTENKDYFWINDLFPRVVMHPYRPDLEGKDVSSFKDANGNYPFVEFVKIIKHQGGGYVDYMWQWKDDPAKISLKSSYVMEFKPWGWVIGTGLYQDDVLADFTQIRNKLSFICTGILFIVSLLAAYSIRQALKADKDRSVIILNQKQLMASLEQSNTRFRNLLETTSDWIWEADQDGRYTYSSPQVFTMLGFTPEETLGKTLMDIASPRSASQLAETFQQRLQNKKNIVGFECTCLGKSGQIVVLENNAVPFVTPNTKRKLVGYRGIARDITERKMALEALKKSRDDLHTSLEETVFSLASTTENRDPYTAGHQLRVDRLACAIASAMGLSHEQIEGLHIAALLHDIGKITLPFEYLAKPTQLLEEERAIIKRHPEVGYSILKPIHFPWPVAEIVYQHHEHLDGSGYPRGLTGPDILLEAKILTVADVVEAITSHRPYRPALGIEKAMEAIREGRGTLYYPPCVDICLDLIQKKKIEFSSDDWCPVFF